MKKLILLLVFIGFNANAQNKSVWTKRNTNDDKIVVYKGVQRPSFPKKFDLYDLDIATMRAELFANKASKIISLPNVDGQIEEFLMTEASNFEPALQAQFPEIRAYSGRGITDTYATLKLSISPQGIQTMIFRTDKPNEFIECYSEDRNTYAVFISSRQKGNLEWTCSTNDEKLASNINSNLGNYNRSSTGQLKTMRLAQSCTAEYANYFGATSSAQVSNVLAAFNATLTRCNGCYEKDLGLHLNLVASSTNVIYYDATTDPYSPAAQKANWNTQLQIALNTTLTGAGTDIAVNNPAYDIGHLFGASGGGGNAGCIGCVCVDGIAAGTGSTKGRGITSPPTGSGPLGDNFDIDYVVHEIGHQLGGNHTFSMSNEGYGVNVEVGSGVTIMGYAGITSQDVAPHSIDKYHAATIAQIQTNLSSKSCIITTNISADNATPVALAGLDYTIPISTPFTLTGAATDANTSDALTYSWEQMNDGVGKTGTASVASNSKTSGPNWVSFDATTSPIRICPKMATVLSNLTTTQGTGDNIKVEALSSIARPLNFRLTVRDNVPYSSVAPITVGQTNFDDMIVTVSSASTPFTVTSQNTAGVSYAGLTTQTISWNPGTTTSAPFNAANVKITLSTDNLNFSTVLAASTPNDGSEIITIPDGITSSSCRIKVEAVENIFFNVNTTVFTITPSLHISDFNLSNFSLFPNPNSGSFLIQFNTSSSENVSIMVHDMQGRLIFDEKYDNNAGIFNQKILLNNAQAGVYLVSVQEADKKVVKRIIVE